MFNLSKLLIFNGLQVVEMCGDALFRFAIRAAEKTCPDRRKRLKNPEPEGLKCAWA